MAIANVLALGFGPPENLRISNYEFAAPEKISPAETLKSHQKSQNNFITGD